MQMCRMSTVSDQEKVLLYIELQAVAQVIVQEVANALDPSDSRKINQLSHTIDNVNAVLNDPKMGGGTSKGHSYALALHMLRHLKSFRRFKELLTTDFDTVCKGVTNLEHIGADLKVKIIRVLAAHN